MNILVIGGTQFLGRAFVQQALDRGHQLTLFNRGKTNPDLFKELKKIVGDRLTELNKLAPQKFDAILDTCGYSPENLRASADLLKDKTKHYIFVSSCSVYDHNNQELESFNEEAPRVDLNIDVTDLGWETYGARKYLCEQEIRAAFPNNHFVVRPGLIVGPYDPTYRFSYWGDRFSEGGRVLAPGRPEAPLQFIDVRDLAEWILHGLEIKLNGTFNAVSPHGQLTLGSFLETARGAINPQAQVKWVPEAFLREQKVSCWSQLPLWVYQETQGFLKVNSARAISQGLKFRPLVETIRDTHTWSKNIYKTNFLSKVLSRKQEHELLVKYQGF